MEDEEPKNDYISELDKLSDAIDNKRSTQEIAANDLLHLGSNREMGDDKKIKDRLDKLIKHHQENDKPVT